MIKKSFISFLFAMVAFGFTACDSDDNNGQVRVPNGAKPSKEFKIGNCDKEEYADDAVKLNVKSWGNGGIAQEFASIELLPTATSSSPVRKPPRCLRARWA